MKNTKTLKDYYKEIIAMAESQGNTEIVDFCNGRIAQIENKAINKGETAKQKENEKIKDILLAKFEMLGEKKVTVTELLQDSEINELVSGSNQKATALLTALKKAEKIVNIKEGKKSYYKLA
jgi:predicted sulfurtransferase